MCMILRFDCKSFRFNPSVSELANITDLPSLLEAANGWGDYYHPSYGLPSFNDSSLYQDLVNGKQLQVAPVLQTNNYHCGTYFDNNGNSDDGSSDEENSSDDNDDYHDYHDNYNSNEDQDYEDFFEDSDSEDGDSDSDGESKCRSRNDELYPPSSPVRDITGQDEFNTILSNTRSNAQNERVQRVEIASIAVSHDKLHCLGIQTTYRTTYESGNVELCHAPIRAYNREEETNWKLRGVNYSRIEFEKGEYLAEIRTRWNAFIYDDLDDDDLNSQGAITHQISFITNLRTVSFGGNGGIGEDMSAPPDLRREIVALNGTFTQMGRERFLGILGSVSISRNWREIGPLVLLRSLIEKGRASPRSLNKMAYAIPRKRKFAVSDKSLKKDDTVMHEFIMDSHQDVFRRILSFLGYGMRV